MRIPKRVPALALTMGLLLAARAPAQQAAVVTDLLTDIGQLEEKLTGLARAIPEDKWSWRPAEGVRSVGEVLLHVAADNWFLPTAVGVAAPSATGILPDNYGTVQAYEGRTLGMADILAEMDRSFAHLKEAMAATPADKLADQITIFGQTFTRQQLWVLTTTHLHEHLGQMIAYARSNGIVPPWSRGS